MTNSPLKKCWPTIAKSIRDLRSLCEVTMLFATSALPQTSTLGSTRSSSTSAQTRFMPMLTIRTNLSSTRGGLRLTATLKRTWLRCYSEEETAPVLCNAGPCNAEKMKTLLVPRSASEDPKRRLVSRIQTATKDYFVSGILFSLTQALVRN